MQGAVCSITAWNQKMFVTKSFILTREKQGKFIFSWHCLGRKGLNTPLEQKIHKNLEKIKQK
jgi:hypothetical protein